ncbi:MAG: heavy-metal-associated domain-containing protein [Cyclobacteriaceae bacterium]|nr:heavy-metal-associated domain-containing protein [Cyclobacteriaceae bacterium]
MTKMQFTTNLKCGGCVAAITPGMDSLEAVKSWKVDLAPAVKILEVEGEEHAEGEILKVVAQAGFAAERI